MFRLFRDQKIGVKMMVGFVAISIITLLVGGLGAYYVQKESDSLALIYQRHVSGINDLKQAQISLLNALSGQKNALVALNPEQRESSLRSMQEAQAAFSDIMQRLAASIKDENEQQLREQIDNHFRVFSQTNADIAASLRSDQAEKAFQLANAAGLKSFEDAQRVLDQFVNVRKQESDREYQTSLERNRTARAWLIGLALVGTFLGLAVGYIVASNVTKPIKQMVAGLRRLEAGDLTHQMHLASRDEMGELAAAYNSFTSRLRHVLGEVQAAATRVGEEVARLSSAAADAGMLSGAAQRKNAAGTLTVEETAAAMARIAEAAESNASLAERAAEEFNVAQVSAVEGREAVEKMVQAVSEINESSQKISQIIHVMDEIALQTNLLALNAAVEAAHAGEEGKGFAVVASEVRSLAQRSAEAAKEIAVLIEESVNRAKAGRELAGSSGEALADMARRVEQVSSLVNSISEASRRQKEAMRDATIAISAIDQTMQQNAREVVSLKKAVSYFRV